jgi:hypothetical protein
MTPYTVEGVARREAIDAANIDDVAFDDQAGKQLSTIVV